MSRCNLPNGPKQARPRVGLSRYSLGLQVQLAFGASCLALAAGRRVGVAPTNNLCLVASNLSVSLLITAPLLCHILDIPVCPQPIVHFCSISYPRVVRLLLPRVLRNKHPHYLAVGLLRLVTLHYITSPGTQNTFNMRPSTIFAPLFLAATTLAQAVPEGIAPSSDAPSGCKTTVQTKFRIGTLENPTLSKRETAQEASDGDLLCTLEDGILHDQYGRTGSVVANRQFQFDGPPQAGAIYTGGWSVCGNNSLAMGGSTRWWRCMSGPFGNLYDESIGAQCHEIRIQAIFDETSSSSSMMSSTTSSALSGSTSILFATSTSGLSSESRSMHSTASAGNNTAFSSATPFSKTDGASATSGRHSSASSPTGAANAPPASGDASSVSMAPFAMFGVSMVFLGAALML
ncbi:covalently-linked cell wall [Pyrenophora seminiperda CCB06]|uniref:Covalently-linked cell wall n=1 Tax=Pyrenophora seminiperda CCB06 TaxID=1302712 RepID=A0A3M7MA70_9PLEO|nr:covalently-linked cell wall [Pyrenophora seminiperda CCB06]